MMQHKACLLVLDGAGYTSESAGNAVRPDTLPTVFAAMREHGFAVLEASGTAVGLEEGQVGNSESGHMTLGAGRVVPCMTRRIDEAFRGGTWAADPGWAPAVEAGVLHVVGLLSDAGVHGLVRSIEQAVHTAAAAGVAEILVHPILDGVDSVAGSAPELLAGLLDRLAGVERCRPGIVIGRKWCCDRSGDLSVTRVATAALASSADLPIGDLDTVRDHVARTGGEADFPAHAFAGGRGIGAGEPVLITSHRADRARQLAGVLAETQPLLMLVDPGEGVDVQHVFFPTETVGAGVASVLQDAGVRSVRVAEKCKFPHVTFFFNGFTKGGEGERVCVPTIAEAEIPGQPEMGAAAVTAQVTAAMADPSRQAIVANLANLDQVGHLGRIDLAERAAAAVDAAFAQIVASARQHGWTVLVTADHGNADCVEKDGRPFGSHTHCPVPFFIVPPTKHRVLWNEQRGSLANVAASFLQALGLRPTPAMHPPLAEVHAH